MSRIFYDHLLIASDLRRDIDSLVETYEEKEEIWGLVDELIHQRIMALILENLHERYHREFLEKFYEAPYHENNMTYLVGKVADMEQFIHQEISAIFREIKELLLSQGGPQEI